MLMVLIGMDHIKCLMKVITNTKLGGRFSKKPEDRMLQLSKIDISIVAEHAQEAECVHKLLDCTKHLLCI